MVLSLFWIYSPLTIGKQGEDSVDKASVAIFPTGIITELPEDGIHIAFGPDMRKTLDETAAEHCKDPKDTQRCAEEINKQLQDSTLKTHSKRFLAVAGAVAEGANIIRIVVSGAVVAVMGMVAAEAVKGPGPAPDSINFEKIADDGVLAQFNRITSASLIAIATGSDNEVSLPIPRHVQCCQKLYGRKNYTLLTVNYADYGHSNRVCTSRFNTHTPT